MSDVTKIFRDLISESDSSKESKFGSILNEDCCDNDDDDYMGDDEGLDIEDDNDDLIMEACLRESLSPDEMKQFLESGAADSLVRMGLLSEKSIVRLDKQAKMSRAETQAMLAIAKEKGDRDFKKLTTVWKLRKFLLSKLEKRYGSQAKQRAKQMQKKGKNASNFLFNKMK